MKKTLISIVVLFLSLVVVSFSNAQINLLCDYDPIASTYILEFDGLEEGPFLPLSIDPGNNTTVVIDIEDKIIFGSTHTIRLKALNAWGDEGEYTDPFEFMLLESIPGVYTTILREVPSKPVGIMLQLP